LDLVLEKLQEAIDTLVSLLKQLQLGIVAAKAALDALLEKLQASVDELREQLNSLLETVKAHAQKFIDDIQIQASVAGLVQKLHDFSEPVLAAADEKLDASSGSVAGFVKRAQADIAGVVDAFDLQIDQLLGLIDAAYEAGQSAGDSLNQQLDSVHSAWEALAAQAQAQVDQTSTHVDELIHQTLSGVAEEVGIEWEPT
jgi:cell division septum initiation protein DivIVA